MIRPRPERDREHQHQHALDVRVAQEVERDPDREADPDERRDAHRELDRGAGDDADRVRVELVVALEQRVEQDDPADDHDVPHQRGERRDREVVVGVEDPDHESVEPEQDHDREQHAREADGERVELRRELVARDERHDHRRERDEGERDQRERRRAAAPPSRWRRGSPRVRRFCSSSSEKTGTNALDSAASATSARIRFGIWKASVNARGRAARAVVGGGDDLARQPGDPREPREDGEDRGVAGAAGGVRARGRSGLGAAAAGPAPAGAGSADRAGSAGTDRRAAPGPCLQGARPAGPRAPASRPRVPPGSAVGGGLRRAPSHDGAL